MKFKKAMSLLICIIIAVSFSGCKKADKNNSDNNADKDKVKIVATVFPLYDFARQVAGDKAEITMLLPTGAEAHSYEPTAQDMIKINESDLFICIGLGADPWAKNVIDNNKNKDFNYLAAGKCSKLLIEDEHDHDDHDDHDTDEHDKHDFDIDTHFENDDDFAEYDEHVWTSLKNSESIVKEIEDKLCKIDPANKDYYETNAKNYIEKLGKLDEEFAMFSNENPNATLVFADRFPFKYLVNDYKLKYIAAFPGCSTETEPSAKTLMDIIDKVKKENIKTIYYTETSNQKMPDTVCEQTGAQKVLMHSCHTVSKQQLNDGVTYLDLMTDNLEALRKLA